jgi:hypothetical protein
MYSKEKLMIYILIFYYYYYYYYLIALQMGFYLVAVVLQ